MPRPKKTVDDKPFAVRFPLPLLEKIKMAAQLMGKSEAEVIRLATEIGLVRLRRINYDIASVIEAGSEWTAAPLKAAEDSPPYGGKTANGGKK